MEPSTGLALFLFPLHPQPSAPNFDFCVPSKPIPAWRCWLIRLSRSSALLVPSPSLLSQASRRRRREWLPTPGNGAQTLHALCLDPARMLAMMEFMMKFGFDSAALAVRGRDQDRYQAPGPGPRPGLGSQHKMACLTNFSTSLL